MGSMLIILLKLCPPEAARIQVPPHGIDFRDEAPTSGTSRRAKISARYRILR
jgi:hypothetical protein